MGLLVAGFIIVVAAAISIVQDAEQNAFFQALIDVNPLAEESTDFSISDPGQPFYIVASRIDENQLVPPTVLVKGKLVDPNGETILTDPDITRGIAKVNPTVAGNYRLYLANTHSTEGARVFITLTHGSIPTTGAETVAVAGTAVAGTIVMMAGVVVMVAGAALFFRERTKSKRDPSIVT